VPQENVDDYFVAAIHRADRVASNDDDHADESLQVRMQSAPAGYFALMGIPVIQGRDFDDSGREDPSAIVIGAATARRWWGHADPIGRRLVSLTPNRRGNLFTVVGVVDETQGGLKDAGTEVRIFGPGVRVTGHFLVRTHAPAQPMQSTIRSVAVGVAPDLPLVSVRTLDAIESAQRRSVTRVMAAIAGVGTLALFLSAIGLYAVVAFAVGQRVREIGIRTALGADRQRVVRWFLLRGLQLCAVGMGIGLSLSVVVVRVIAAIRAEEPPDGVIGLAAVTAGVAIAVALLATWIPARRAAQIDPIVALRIE